ncbi:MAG TPA: anhydro-N-acetylmuramic acid kinase [Bacteroidales bacterium]|mgnify:CR=1 FL=1|nr:anhydro-N-acetylmuramic acid kinase [Bacteroidales bacterium]HQI70558.1 anhydro-N-acetylmuramic acid kinase [Bacteroidales bacterium]
MPKKYHVVGLMSGTSLDGLDIAYCLFEYSANKWSGKIIKASTIKYTETWKKKLSQASSLPALDFMLLHNEYGRYCGQQVKKFLSENQFRPDFISSHGHTIFHQPQKQLTVQIGSGASLAAETGITTISDFRISDVALQGQGAPLVPIGDELLFADYDICLNIGGISNLSYNKKSKRIAFDVSPANIVLNYLARKAGKDFDTDGKTASSGKVSLPLLAILDQQSYYSLKPPKSLGREWIETAFLSVLNNLPEITLEDKLRTCTEHIAGKIAQQINTIKAKKVLVTGGGALNKFLMSRITQKCKAEIIIPSKETVEYKEALIFAFLGVLRMRNENNCLKSVTGARKDNCGGTIYLP